MTRRRAKDASNPDRSYEIDGPKTIVSTRLPAGGGAELPTAEISPAHRQTATQRPNLKNNRCYTTPKTKRHRSWCTYTKQWRRSCCPHRGVARPRIPCSGEEFWSRLTPYGPGETTCMRRVNCRAPLTPLRRLYDATCYSP